MYNSEMRKLLFVELCDAALILNYFKYCIVYCTLSSNFCSVAVIKSAFFAQYFSSCRFLLLTLIARLIMVFNLHIKQLLFVSVSELPLAQWLFVWLPPYSLRKHSPLFSSKYPTGSFKTIKAAESGAFGVISDSI